MFCNFFNIIRLTCQWVAKIRGTYMGTYIVRENRSTRLDHKFLNIDSFLTKLQLSNGAKIIKNGSISKKL